jgi:hypothetical protein
MTIYVLKRYQRNRAGISAGIKIEEWAIEAADLIDAKVTARKILTDYRPPGIFVVMWDEIGKLVWQEGIHD